ncbi:hypothetical protein EDB19DRAFT_1851407 [Suillus lakei]|nr:hypothetical protein EDB19DRAFT_1851407 [Suillus lakei]
MEVSWYPWYLLTKCNVWQAVLYRQSGRFSSQWLKYHGPAYPSFQDTPEVVRMHLDHYIKMIRQTIICNVDVTMITWDRVQGHKIPYPSFNTCHQCREYEKKNILDWANKHVVHIDQSEVTRGYSRVSTTHSSDVS